MIGSIAIIGGIALIFIILGLMIMEAKKEQKAGKNHFLKTYLLIVSIIAIGGGTIALGFVIFPSLERVIISDFEHGRNRREYTQCSDDYRTKVYYDDTTE